MLAQACESEIEHSQPRNFFQKGVSVFLLNWSHTEKRFIVVCSWTHTIKLKDRFAYCVFKYRYVIFLCVCVCV